jgi:diguanylate cyclase (GGDEF)-like protein/PAS domain S-box-containing protein
LFLELAAVGNDFQEILMSLQAEANLAALIESVEDLVWSVDREYRLTVFNRKLKEHIKQTFGIDAIVGMTPKDLLPSSNAALWPPLYDRALSGNSFRSEFPLSDGRTLELSFNPITVNDEIVGASVFGKDITERKALERAREAAESEYHEIFNGALEGIYRTTLDGKLLMANGASARILGYASVDEVLASVTDLSREVWLDQNDRANHVKQLLESGSVRGTEYRFKRKDGSIAWVSLSSRLVSGTDGKPLHIEGYFEDITEHKVAMADLAEREVQFRRFFEENSSVMLLVEPRTGEIIAANKAATAFYGYSKEQLVGMLTSQISLRASEDLALDRMGVIDRGAACFDYCHRLANGEIRDVELYSSPFDVYGRRLLYAIVHDVTERKLAEKRLRDSEREFRATFEQAAVGIVHTSLQGRFMRCNARFAEIIGYTKEEVPGLTIHEITLPEDFPKSMESLDQIATGTAEDLKLEKRYLRKDGSLIWVKLTVSAQCDDEGRVLYNIAIVEDIDARKAGEQSLAAAIEALRLSESRYRTTFEMSLDVISINRMGSGKYIDVNQAFTNLCGYQRDEVIGRTSEEIGLWVDSRDRERVSELVRESGSCRDLEAQFRRKNGEHFWGLLSGSVIEIGGEPCLLSVTRDITAAKVAEKRLAAAMESVRLSEIHYRTIFQTSADGVAISKLSNGQYIDVNKAFLEIVGYEFNEVVGRTSIELNFWVDPAARHKMVADLIEHSSFKDTQTQYVKKDGSIIWVLISASTIDIDGIHCVLAVIRDITAAKLAEERVAAARKAQEVSEARYSIAFKTSLDAVNITRLCDGTILDVNKAFLDIIGFDREDVIGRTSLELNIWADPHDRERLIELLRKDSNCQGIEAQFKKRTGEVIWGQMSASVIEIDGNLCMLSITRDITQAKLAEEEIKSLAFFDTLTHLPNRRYVSDRLRQALSSNARNNRKGALLFIDLDNFKTLNDTLGHKMGDHMLKEVALRLTACIREADTVARLGGDEFVVILGDLAESDQEAAVHAKVVAAKILHAISLPYLLENRECLSTCSIGVALFGDRTDTIDDVLQHADIAMYQAKAAGRNTIHFFAASLQTAIKARASMEEDMRQAIRTSQFQLYYQPQVHSGTLIGAEALLRWIHPNRGCLLPNEFIPLAEDTGLIVPLGEWVLDVACKRIAAWGKCERTAHLTIAVNISARQFRQPNFVGQVLDAVHRNGATPYNLKLELTESMFVDNLEEVIRKMKELKVYGLRFSLDDFGTGYSSLSYLKRLPLDQLKIDRAFVRDMLVDSTSGTIAKTVISLSNAMGLDVIAEGVETEEQRLFLAEHGCHSYQGYLFGRPLPLECFELLLPVSKEDDETRVC